MFFTPFTLGLVILMGLEILRGVDVTTLMPPDPTTVGVAGAGAAAEASWGAGTGTGLGTGCRTTTAREAGGGTGKGGQGQGRHMEGGQGEVSEVKAVLHALAITWSDDVVVSVRPVSMPHCCSTECCLRMTAVCYWAETSAEAASHRMSTR